MPERKKILVIDDSAFLCKILKGTLDAAGFETITASCTKDGVAILKQQAPELILIDINLPDVEGDLACKVIKGVPRCQDVPIVLISGSDEGIIARKVKEAGAQGYLKKPFSPSSILRWIAGNTHLLDKLPSEGAAAVPAPPALAGAPAPSASLPPPAVVPAAPAAPAAQAGPVAPAVPAAPEPARASEPAGAGSASCGDPSPIGDLPVAETIEVDEETVGVAETLAKLDAEAAQEIAAPGDSPEGPSPVSSAGEDGSAPARGDLGDVPDEPSQIPRWIAKGLCKAKTGEPDFDVLIIDDSKFLRGVLEDTLEKAWYQVRTSPSMVGATRLMLTERPRLVLMDINLPDMVGDEACFVFKNIPSLRDIKVVLISGGREEVIQEKVRNSSADGYLIKPFTPVSVLEWLEASKESLLPGRVEPEPPALAEDVPATSAAEAMADIVPLEMDDLADLAPTMPKARAARKAVPAAADSAAGAAVNSIVPVLVEQLSSRKPEVRMQACYSLGEVKAKGAVEPLLKALGDEDGSVRSDAIWALGEIGDARVVASLLRSVDSEEGVVKERAIEALGKIGDGKAVFALAKCLGSSDKNVRLMATKALGRIGDEAAGQALRLMLQDPDPEVSANAFHALETMGEA